LKNGILSWDKDTSVLCGKKNKLGLGTVLSCSVVYISAVRQMEALADFSHPGEVFKDRPRRAVMGGWLETPSVLVSLRS